MMSTINSTPSQPYFAPPLSADEGTQSERAERSKRGIAESSKRWPDGVVTVAIDIDDPWNRAVVISAIKEWEKHTPALKFKIVLGKQGDIRISGDATIKGDWSAIGTDAQRVPKNEPTMHLDRQDDLTLAHNTALHEFGHALGLKHEHQHPDRTIKFDKKGLFESFRNAGVEDEDIESQIVQQWPAKDRLATAYDEHSIMHYAFGADTTEDKKKYPEPTQLSEGDKQIIRLLYTPKKLKQPDTSR